MPSSRSSALLLGILLSAGRAAGQTALPVVAAADAHAVPGQTITVPVTTSQPMTIGSSDLTLHFDASLLDAMTADSTLDGFRFAIDAARGVVTSASASGGPGQALAAGDALMQVTFRVRADAPAGCTPLTIADADGVSPDDVAGPVPPVPPAPIVYATRAGSVCVAVCDTCDDDDSCTTDACDRTAGRCVHPNLAATDPASAACRLANIRRVEAAPPLPVCRATCPKAFDRQIAKVDGQLKKAVAAGSASRCRKRMRAAAQAAQALKAHVARFAAHGGFVPVERGTRLTAEASALADRLKALRGTYCTRGAS